MDSLLSRVSSDEWMMLVILLLFIVGLRVLSYWLTEKTKKYLEIPTEDACPPHSWTVKTVDPDDPSFGTYLVCSKCGQTPNNLREEKYRQ